jgi:hypothetical protein
LLLSASNDGPPRSKNWLGWACINRGTNRVAGKGTHRGINSAPTQAIRGAAAAVLSCLQQHKSRKLAIHPKQHTV